MGGQSGFVLWYCSRPFSDFPSSSDLKRSIINTLNQEKLPFNHRGGSMSFGGMEIDEENLEEPNGRISLYRHSHWKKEVGWINPESESRYNAMIELKREQLSLDMSERLSEAEICDKVLGKRSGFAKGLGFGPRPKSSKSMAHPLPPLEVDTEKEQMKAEIESLKQKLDQVAQFVQNCQEQSESSSSPNHWQLENIAFTVGYHELSGFCSNCKASMEAFIANLFSTITLIKASYVELQIAQFPYNADAIELADQAVVNESAMWHSGCLDQIQDSCRNKYYQTFFQRRLKDYKCEREIRLFGVKAMALNPWGCWLIYSARKGLSRDIPQEDGNVMRQMLKSGNDLPSFVPFAIEEYNMFHIPENVSASKTSAFSTTIGSAKWGVQRGDGVKMGCILSEEFGQELPFCPHMTDPIVLDETRACGNFLGQLKFLQINWLD
ncbi:hypothetical protein LguiA_030130 [Lonicera macranthoides]